MLEAIDKPVGAANTAFNETKQTRKKGATILSKCNQDRSWKENKW
jgi:hypothetical protein